MDNHDAQWIDLLKTVILSVIAPLVAWVLWWTKRQQTQLDKQDTKLDEQDGELAECQRKHLECETAYLILKDEVARHGRIIKGARDDVEKEAARVNVTLAYLLRRGQAEAASKGLLVDGVISPQAQAALGSIAAKLEPLRSRALAMSDLELFTAVEETAGADLADKVCRVLGVYEAACAYLAIYWLRNRNYSC